MILDSIGTADMKFMMGTLSSMVFKPTVSNRDGRLSASQHTLTY